MIERNKNPTGRLSNVVFGVTYIVDGLVRVFSCGFLYTRFPIEFAKQRARRNIERMRNHSGKENNDENQNG